MPKVWDSSTVMTPSLPTLSMASEIRSPISVSAAEMDATWAICSLVSVSLEIVLQRADRGLDGGLDAPLEGHRVGAGGHVAQALANQGPGQHGGGGGAVTGDVVGLLGYFLDQLGPDLLVGVLELDLLGDGDAVVGDGGGAPLLLQHHVAALGAERDAHGVGELVHPALQRPAGVLVEGNQLGHLSLVPSVGRTTVSTLTSRVLTVNRLRGVSATAVPAAKLLARAAGTGRGLGGPPPGTQLSRRRPPGRSTRWPRPAPACRRPSRKRMSSSARKTLTNRRSWPLSSNSRSANPGWAASSALSTSATVAPSTLTSLAPPARGRSWVGMRTVTAMASAPPGCRRRRRRPPAVGAMVAVGRQHGATASTVFSPLPVT